MIFYWFLFLVSVSGSIVLMTKIGCAYSSKHLQALWVRGSYSVSEAIKAGLYGCISVIFSCSPRTVLKHSIIHAELFWTFGELWMVPQILDFWLYCLGWSFLEGSINELDTPLVSIEVLQQWGTRCSNGSARLSEIHAAFLLDEGHEF